MGKRICSYGNNRIRKSWGGEFCFVGFESDGGVFELNREGNCICFRGCEPKGEVCVLSWDRRPKFVA